MSAAFHLNNKKTKCEPEVNFNNETLPFCYEPKCLRVTLDRSLTYRQHLESLRKKLTSGVALLRWLPGSRCSAGATTLRTTTLALVYSTAGYCAPGAAVLIPASSTPPSTTPGELWLDACVLHQRKTFPPSQASNLLSFVAVAWHCLSSTPCHGARTPASLSAHLSIECKCMAPIETPICTRRTTTHQLIWQQHTCSPLGRSLMECWVGGKPHKTLHFHHRHWHPPPGAILPGRAWVRLNRLCTGVGRFRPCLYKRGLAFSAVCECGAKEHGLTVLDDEIIEWLLNTCPQS